MALSRGRGSGETLHGFASTSSFQMPSAALLEDIRRDATTLADNLATLLASLRTSLANSADCTHEHLQVYQAASESVVADTRESVHTASAFVDACVQLGTEMEALEQCAEQTRQLRATVDALELAANKVMPPSRTSGGGGASGFLRPGL